MNKQQLDKLIKDWTDELLTPDIDEQITDSLLNFVDNDDTEIEVNDLIDIHIQQLAMEENITRLRKWRIFVSSAAASVVILIVASVLLTRHEYDSQTAKKTLAVENQVKDKPKVFNSVSTVIIPDSTSMIMTKASIEEEPKVTSNSIRKRLHAGKELKEKEAMPELNLNETIAEINAGLGNMVDNATECLKMTNVSLLPVNLFSDNTESYSSDLSPNESPSPHYGGQMQKIDIFESNLINTLYEIRNLNIDLNFETDNKKTEI